MHLILWKFIIVNLVQVSTENKPFSAQSVWRSARWRFESKVKALNERVQIAQRHADTKDTKPPNYDRRSEPAEPLARITELGIQWNTKILDELTE